MAALSDLLQPFLSFYDGAGDLIFLTTFIRGLICTGDNTNGELKSDPFLLGSEVILI